MNYELQNEISRFLHYEAYLLDNRRYKEWLDLLSDDIVYCMPARMSVDYSDGNNIEEETKYFEETKASLTTRVLRLYTPSAWVERPAPRQRHFISNIMIEPTSNSNEYKVRSYFSFTISRWANAQVEQLIGERVDILRKENGEWKIVSRVIYPDQPVLNIANLGIFL